MKQLPLMIDTPTCGRTALRHLTRTVVRQEIDLRVALNEQRQHGTPDVRALLIDVHEHRDARPLDQPAYSLSLAFGVRHENSFRVRELARAG
jgi:hypothetical protein